MLISLSWMRVCMSLVAHTWTEIDGPSTTVKSWSGFTSVESTSAPTTNLSGTSQLKQEKKPEKQLHEEETISIKSHHTHVRGQSSGDCGSDIPNAVVVTTPVRPRRTPFDDDFSVFPVTPDRVCGAVTVPTTHRTTMSDDVFGFESVTPAQEQPPTSVAATYQKSLFDSVFVEAAGENANNTQAQPLRDSSNSNRGIAQLQQRAKAVANREQFFNSVLQEENWAHSHIQYNTMYSISSHISKSISDTLKAW